VASLRLPDQSTRADLAKKTIANFIEKASRLYEQKRRAVSAATALELYVRRWLMWATGGIVCQRHRSEAQT
jgi:hypothetical protein